MTSSKKIRDHEYWMQKALQQAERARREDETPIGAVLVLDGQVIGRGRNQRETRQDVTLHAEMIAIRQANRRLSSWRLENSTLYVTLEPCVMCAGAIVQARIGQVVYGASDPKAGACGSVTDIFALNLNHKVVKLTGILAAECSTILKDFFTERRRQDKADGSRAKRKNAAIQNSSSKSFSDSKR